MNTFNKEIFGSYSISGNRDKPEVLSLSGGRSSAYTLMMLLNGGFGKSGDIISFQNTGCEHETCYKFLNDLQKYCHYPITWLEYRNSEQFDGLLRSDFSYDRFYEGGYSHIFEIFDVKKLYKIQYAKSRKNEWYVNKYSDSTESFTQVTFDTASRNGKPFTSILLYKWALRLMQRKDLILPNAAQRWCTNDMKIRVLERYIKSLGIESYNHYFGIRFDEPDRVDKLFRLNDSANGVYHDCPLHWEQVTKQMVSDAWRGQPIDLGLDGNVNIFRDFIGNCVFCHLKAKIKKLFLIQQGYDIKFWIGAETIVNNYNKEWSAMSKQAGSYEQLVEEAMNMREIKIEEVLSDTEMEIHCFGCGD